MRGSLLCAVLLALLVMVHPARILMMLPYPGKSHFIFTSSVIKALTDRGHQVVAYSPFPPSKPMPNYTHFEVHTSFEEASEKWSYEDFIAVVSSDQPVPGTGFLAVWKMFYSVCEEVFKHENIKKLINSNEHFDLVVTESTFGQESMLVFGHRFGAPTITLQGFVISNVLNRVAGNALSIASIPDMKSTTFTDQMTFKERTLNLFSTVATLYTFYNWHLPVHQDIINKHYSGKAPSIEDLVSNVSLYIVNSHPAVGYAQPYTPNIVPVAGISIKEERTTLPQDIQKFMDRAVEGVIYFSFGTVVPLHIFPKDFLQIFINVFKKLKYKVIWKIELQEIPELSQNVILRKWLPQPGILAHPNCVLFLTHGGLNSQLEAIHAGVPTVSIPFFGDQKYNIRFSEHRGIGVKVDFDTLSEESLTAALKTVLENKSYKENAQQLSRIFRDRPVSPADSVVFWTEYVLNHRGAHHLRPTAAQLSWYQLSLLDIVAVLLTVILVVVLFCIIIIAKILSLVLRRTLRKQIINEKKKKN